MICYAEEGRCLETGLQAWRMKDRRADESHAEVSDTARYPKPLVVYGNE